MTKKPLIDLASAQYWNPAGGGLRFPKEFNFAEGFEGAEGI